MANELQGRRIAFMVANEGIEQVELTEPAASASVRPGPGRSSGIAALPACLLLYLRGVG
jgi:hypothetical protein